MIANLITLGHFGALFQIFWGFKPIRSVKTYLEIFSGIFLLQILLVIKKNQYFENYFL